MIIDGFLNALSNVLSTVISALPAWNAPAFFSTVIGLWTQALAGTSAFAHWIPLPIISFVATAVFAAVGISITTRIVRIVISLFTAGGGSVQ